MIVYQRIECYKFTRDSGSGLLSQNVGVIGPLMDFISTIFLLAAGSLTPHVTARESVV